MTYVAIDDLQLGRYYRITFVNGDTFAAYLGRMQSQKGQPMVLAFTDGFVLRRMSVNLLHSIEFIPD
tara:strand:- start:35 stop:235 length:201 start_codon:yes stop_codon:yes gene_type:complete